MRGGWINCTHTQGQISPGLAPMRGVVQEYKIVGPRVKNRAQGWEPDISWYLKKKYWYVYCHRLAVTFCVSLQSFIQVGPRYPQTWEFQIWASLELSKHDWSYSGRAKKLKNATSGFRGGGACPQITLGFIVSWWPKSMGFNTWECWHSWGDSGNNHHPRYWEPTWILQFEEIVIQ